MAGYHLTNIKKGTLGKVSKIQEELDEIKDAIDQNVKIMVLVELSDLIGAAKMVIEQQGESFDQVLKSRPPFPNQGSLDLLQEKITEAQKKEDEQDKCGLINQIQEIISVTEEFAIHYDVQMQDLLSMQAVTERAFTSGSRKSNE